MVCDVVTVSLDVVHWQNWFLLSTRAVMVGKLHVVVSRVRVHGMVMVEEEPGRVQAAAGGGGG